MVACEIFLTNHSFTMNPVYRIILNTLTTRYCNLNYRNGLMFITIRPFKTSHYVVSEKKFNLDPSKIVKRDGIVVRKKTEKDKQITLFHGSEEKVLTLTEALKIAAHKRLHLVKIKKPTSKSMDYYQLSKVPEFGSNQLDNKKKEVKRYVFRINIAEHDLLVKARGLINALNKYKVGSYIIEGNTKEPEKTGGRVIYPCNLHKYGSIFIGMGCGLAVGIFTLFFIETHRKYNGHARNEGMLN